ncbi:hypothetical protein [Streptomyces europaeiscabiei]|uniref:hypothetical protein n=1 Tax=Streptomyces europaeiscabiei TaxID=146819 RepID=UPI0029B5F2E2|nr:hypothetical protein [Streptomyces europaeiscabiei]MDX3584225.1 hypothetical protein [Streptomyces europaeiscabiei]MDX3619371.1 hypothetical protein [Streptomyces europaeiscabiei]MDX3629532.1 hypothetical protein [Streptomyces europaeiscabiei]MDX3648149.1 hypothetical protein [Streptomyces europaeiscabiei]WUD32857.1 hypothetical protein OG858_16435 [Streptomyces europaeiscabiei]
MSALWIGAAVAGVALAVVLVDLPDLDLLAAERLEIVEVGGEDGHRGLRRAGGGGDDRVQGVLVPAGPAAVLHPRDGLFGDVRGDRLHDESGEVRPV